MKRTCAYILVPAVLLGLLGSLGAATPKKKPVGSYSTLWSKSPFTVPPLVEVDDEGPGVLEDYVLTGVSKLPDGYFVTLMDKKKRENRVAIIPGEVNSLGFKVVSVVQDPIKYMETKVKISVGGETGTIGYDEKFLPLKKIAVAAKKPAPKKPGARPTRGRPPVPGVKTQRPPTSGANKPRVRRVPTPPSR